MMKVHDVPFSGGAEWLADGTFSGDHALQHEEPLIFERGRAEVSGVDLPDADLRSDRLNGLHRTEPIGIPGLSEPEAIRHYVRLSQLNAAIDTGFYPLGSCTMKHNPRLGEKLARLRVLPTFI